MIITVTTITYVALCCNFFYFPFRQMTSGLLAFRSVVNRLARKTILYH